MNKQDAKKQFDNMTEELGIKHTFPFDIAWSFAKYVEIKGGLENPLSFLPSEYTKEEFMVGINDVENKMLESEMSLKGKELEDFNPLKHSFAKGVYIREVFNPVGELLVTKIHKYSHPFFLLQGEMTILGEDGEKRIKAPHYGITKAGTKRIIYAHTDCIFVTVHATDETDLNKIEEEIISKDFEDKG
jgi:hypothetical protein